ncbi:PREDICTED: cyclic phosphodiesterase [Prunus dulcis]|uniref:PREDICTED: cyclic phosphodiesterase n=1 Tax=Prunus dulcis TaxID=3755 RepID=A0A5E4FEB4_PRUDU|nr:cyclic phosphodiesterase-like [Prunus dulcis]VVA26305.1 PREDICTED: cyclic phosphodiesterase [Prunus dulcis]
MENSETTTTISSAPNPVRQKVQTYAAWAVIPDHVSNRIKKVMEGLRDEFGGPEITPHIPVLGSIRTREDDVIRNFKEACGKSSCFPCTVVDVLPGPFYYQNVYLFIHPDQVTYPIRNFTDHFDQLAGMPHFSLLYGELTDEEKEKAKERAMVLDDGLVGLTFTITRFALYKCNKDRTQQSWEKIAEHSLPR